MWRSGPGGAREFTAGKESWAIAAGVAQECPGFAADVEEEMVADEARSCYNCRYRRWSAASFTCQLPALLVKEIPPVPVNLLHLKELSYSYPGASAPALSELSFSVAQGECVCLTGNSGCGKSTLLLAVLGQLRGGKLQGSIEVPEQPEDERWSVATGMVFQNPESQMLCTSVAEEVAFGPENLRVDPREIARRVEDALRAVGLDGQQARSAERFSAGQKQRLTVASVLSMQPKLLLLDEPTSQLDAQGKDQLCQILCGLKVQGYTLIIAEHDPRPFAGLIDRYLLLEQGRLTGETSSLPKPDQYLPPEAAPARAGTAQSAPAPIAVRGLNLSYPETGEVLKQLDLEVGRGERVHLFGANGAGKSSLLRCLAGLESPDSGKIRVAGLQHPRPEQLPGKVGVLFQNPARQLFAESVQDEVAFTLYRLGHTRYEVNSLLAEALVLCGIAHLAGRAPLTLSFGEQHRVALAAIVAPRPELLLLDEPFAGLDYPQRLALLDILAQMPGRYGTTVLIASHDVLPDARWADRSLVLSGGTLGEIFR
jgi:energy-coupling factor transport system ATP-binding protein